MIVTVFKSILTIFTVSALISCAGSKQATPEKQPKRDQGFQPVVEQPSAVNEDDEHRVEHVYHANGQLQYEAYYLDGKLDGTARHWDENGVLISSVDYQLGKIHGKWTQYYKTGGILQETEYYMGFKNGLQRRYHTNGVVSSEVEYSMDEQVSEMIRWDSNGRLIH